MLMTWHFQETSHVFVVGDVPHYPAARRPGASNGRTLDKSAILRISRNQNTSPILVMPSMMKMCSYIAPLIVGE